MFETKVVNKRRDSYDVYIGRGSIWGNPFVIGKDGDRNTVIRKYKYYIINKLKTGEITLSKLLSLKGKRLGCFCAPLACHGDVLVLLLNYIEKKIAVSVANREDKMKDALGNNIVIGDTYGASYSSGGTHVKLVGKAIKVNKTKTTLCIESGEYIERHTTEWRNLEVGSYRPIQHDRLFPVNKDSVNYE